MKTETVYICDHCSAKFDKPCEEHEEECFAKKNLNARTNALLAYLLGEKTDDAVGAKINGKTFLIAPPFTKKEIKFMASAKELISASNNPSALDQSVINRVNAILSQ